MGDNDPLNGGRYGFEGGFKGGFQSGMEGRGGSWEGCERSFKGLGFERGPQGQLRGPKRQLERPQK